MVAYPGPFDGAYPLDPSTNVGKYRLLLGDAEGTRYSPDEPGRANYAVLSDAEIETFVSQGGDSVTRGIAYYYLRLAGEAAKESASIQDQDLRVDLTKKSAELRAMAQFWLDQGDNDDAISAEDAFEIVPTGVSSGGFIPEGSPAMWGREYTIGRWIR